MQWERSGSVLPGGGFNKWLSLSLMGKATCSGASTLENWLISHRRAGDTHVRARNRTLPVKQTYPSRRFFFFDDFFSFFFDDGTGVSSGFLFPATCTNAPDAGAAPAAVPKRCALASSIA